MQAKILPGPKKVWYREAFEDGEEQGQILKLIELIRRKLRKGKAPEAIAEESEESFETVEQICVAVNKCGLEADMKVNYDQLLQSSQYLYSQFF